MLLANHDTYKGTSWYTGTGDNGGVHTNSGVLNYWFYLLSIGGSGTNDIGTAFNVTGVGIDKAGAIAYRLNTFYLVSTSKYADARTFGIKAAEDLYGVGSVEAIQTANAFTAVGVGGTVVAPSCTDAYEANNTAATAKIPALNSDLKALISSSTDKDWFKFTTTAAAPKVQISLFNLPKDYDVKLYSSNGTTVLATGQNGGTTAETIKYNTSTVAATYYFQIYGYGGVNSTSCYSFRASTSGVNFFDAGNAGVIASNKLGDNETFNVFPNPSISGTAVNVKFNEANAGVKNVLVTDMMGRKVFVQNITATKGINSVNLNMPKLTAGVYIVKFDGNNFKKITIQ